MNHISYPWPPIGQQPTPQLDDGRFAKSFPIEFPMGQGDLHQPRLRGDFSPEEWAQHLFLYFDGRFLSSTRGHRVTWAIFNTVLLEDSRSTGS